MARKWKRFLQNLSEKLQNIFREFISIHPFVCGCLVGFIIPVAFIFIQPFIFSQPAEVSGLFPPPDLTNTVLQPTILNNGYKILCVVTTHPSNYKSKVVHIKATWGRRCDHLIFLSTRNCGLFNWNCSTIWRKLSLNNILQKEKGIGDGSLFTILEVEGHTGRKDLWTREKIGFERIWEEFKDFDFMLKTDDDSFIVVENLKYLLQDFNPREALLLGHLQKSQGVEYMSGGSGYVISREGVRRLVEEGFQSRCELPLKSDRQNEKNADEDLQMGVCAKLLDFQIVPSDFKGGMTFIPFKIEHILLHKLNTRPGRWFRQHSLECRDRLAKDCLSQHPVAFHYTEAVDMYKLEYLIYSARVIS